MAKKTKKNEHGFEVPDYEKFSTIEEVEEELQKHKDILIRKDKTEFQIKESKKEAVSAHNEQLKELNEERMHEVAVIDALNDRKKQLLSAVVVPFKPASVG